MSVCPAVCNEASAVDAVSGADSEKLAAFPYQFLNIL